ncbi:MAG: exodeoxyribonuclease VII small subunit [Lachnospiraceae bacterium]|nr:exodeoxyribonuclease VII small subunit [Lachnospiraceae bacterium]
MSKKAENAAPQEVSLEEAFAELEDILEQLEDEDKSLEESFALYKRGLELTRLCHTRIEGVEKQLAVLEEENGFGEDA